MSKNKVFKQRSWLENLSQAEKYFWLTIIILLVLYIILHFFAAKNLQAEKTAVNIDKNEPSVLYEIILSDQVQNNLQLSASLLEKNKALEIKLLAKNIDDEVDSLFFPVINTNIDTFLDFHYSVVGEYVELGNMAFGKIGSSIQQKLLGEDFASRLQAAVTRTDAGYIEGISRHLSTIKQYASQKVDMNLNAETFDSLQIEINKNITQQQGKIALLLGARFAPKIVSLISMKMAAKISGKMAAKTVAKAATKTASASSWAVLGGFCGPGIIICSPALAIGAWFATDLAMTNGDEYLHRDEFRAEIISLLNKQKEVLKSKLKDSYSRSFRQLSEATKEQYTELEIREKISISDRIFPQSE